MFNYVACEGVHRSERCGPLPRTESDGAGLRPGLKVTVRKGAGLRPALAVAVWESLRERDAVPERLMVLVSGGVIVAEPVRLSDLSANQSTKKSMRTVIGK